MIVLFAALLGASLGSFYGCAAYRLPRGISLTERRSFCPSCQAPIAWQQNIPVLSWLLLRGRSSCCQEEISPRYLLLEIAGAALGLLAALLFGLWGLLTLAAITLIAGAGAELVNSRQAEK